MKKIYFMKSYLLSVLALGVMGMVSCSDDDTPSSRPGTLGTIQLDREVIGACQPFVATCAVTTGDNVINEKFAWVYENAGINIPREVIPQNGKVSGVIRFDEVGEHALRLEYSSNSVSQVYNDEQEVSVTVVPTDVRNSFWGESQTESLRNLRYYSTLSDAKQTDAYLTFNEVTKLPGSTEEKRSVRYSYEQNRLAEVLYVSDLNEKKAQSVLRIMSQYLRELEYEGFDNLVLSYEVKEGQVLTDAEQAIADQFVAKKIGQYDTEGVLGTAVKEGKVKLFMKGNTEKSVVAVETGNSEKEGTVCRRTYNPNK